MFKNIKNPLKLDLSGLLLITIIAGSTVLLYGQTGWAAIFNCAPSPSVCKGTAGDDIMFAAYPQGSWMEGLAGNDYIIGTGVNPTAYLEVTVMIF